MLVEGAEVVGSGVGDVVSRASTSVVVWFVAVEVVVVVGSGVEVVVSGVSVSVAVAVSVGDRVVVGGLVTCAAFEPLSRPTTSPNTA